MRRIKRILTAKLAFSLAVILMTSCGMSHESPKLYWFIPDGTRADPELFKMFQWAKEGKLPHIKQLMEEGAYGYSIPSFPSHTPTNFASLFTGATPKVHGVADGPMHTEGHPLVLPSVAGFSSTAKWVPPVWNIMEQLDKKVLLLSLPGSTPPELEKGITIRGRWGGWGFDTYKVIFEPKRILKKRKKYGNAFKLFFIGSKLTQFVEQIPKPGLHGPVLESALKAHGYTAHLEITDSSGDGVQNYDRAVFYLDYGAGSLEKSGGSKTTNKSADFCEGDSQNTGCRRVRSFTLAEGEWSDWLPVSLKFKGLKVDSHLKVKLISLNDKGIFRVRILYNNVNQFMTEPGFVAKEMTEALGPMVDFADNWPPQLIYSQKDKQTFLEESRMSLDFHKRAVDFLFRKYNPDVFIHNIYTPNQMLESRWWMQYADTEEANRGAKQNTNFQASGSNVKESDPDPWPDLLDLYKGLDAIVGQAMKKLHPKKDIIVFSSDHGVCRLKKLVRLNNLFAKKGWLKFAMDPKTGETKIDWSRTQVVYLKMAHVYINPEGLGGNWKRASGKMYENLREEVKTALQELKNSNGFRPLSRAVFWEQAEKMLELPASRVGDLVLEVHPPYFWFEEVSQGLKVFTKPLTSGFKQTINPEKHKCIWTPFIIRGKGIKPGYKLVRPIRHIDQLPTILKGMGLNPDLKHIEGRVLNELFLN